MSAKTIRLDPLPYSMSGLRLDKAIAQLPEISSRSQAAILIDNENVLVNGRVGKSSYILSAGDRIEIQLEAPPPSDLVAWDFPLDIVYEDSDLIVVNKPAGMVAHPAAGHYEQTLVNALLHHTKSLSEGSASDRPGLVHRIDKETSGLLVIAKNNSSHEKLAQQFKDRTIDRKYWAVVEGKLKSAEGSIESYLTRHPTHRKKFASLRDPKTKKVIVGKGTSDIGKWAKTHYKVLWSRGNLHYLELKLETGRTHQIRVHLSEMGCPIVGDELYGSKKDLPRFLLHAAELGFTHPTTGKRLFFKVDWPKEDKDLIASWGLLSASP
jgi:23S rRNA pseudouridine1911/1915/1917 synthase